MAKRFFRICLTRSRENTFFSLNFQYLFKVEREIIFRFKRKEIFVLLEPGLVNKEAKMKSNCPPYSPCISPPAWS